MLLLGKVRLRNIAYRRSCIKRIPTASVLSWASWDAYSKLHQEYSLYQNAFPEVLGSSREGTHISAIVCRSRGNKMAPVPADRRQLQSAAMLLHPWCDAFLNTASPMHESLPPFCLWSFVLIRSWLTRTCMDLPVPADLGMTPFWPRHHHCAWIS